jgi:hypothetical protein
LPPPADRIAAIDERLRDWRQGDAVIGNAVPFLSLADYARPITPEAQEAAANDPSAGEDPLGVVTVDVPGVVVVTQSCELVRSCADRPFVTVAALVEVDASILQEVKQFSRPRYAYVPAIANRRLVADLQRTTTVEKAVLATISASQRVRGCETDQQARELAMALGRNLNRAALPDDFNNAMRAVQRQIQRKYGRATQDARGKPTNEGALFEALREIRVAFAPSRDASNVDLIFFFIFNSRTDIPTDGDVIVEALLKKFKSGGRFSNPVFRLVTLSEISAEAYLTSDHLELDDLSYIGD